MKTARQFLLIAAVSALLGACWRTQSPEPPQTAIQQATPARDGAAAIKITGIVRQPDGQPAAGLPVRMVGALWPCDGEVKTDAGGKFELEWNQRQFGQNDSTACILVRDAEHNLAVAQDMDEDTGPLDLKLAPGLTLAGRAECDGKPVTNATASLVFWTGRSGMWLQGLARTNTPRRDSSKFPRCRPAENTASSSPRRDTDRSKFTMSTLPPMPAGRNSIRWNSSWPTSSSPARCSTRTTSPSPTAM